MPPLFDEQWQFFQDLMLLGTQVRAAGWSMSLRGVWRPEELQKIYLKQGVTSTLNSDHLDALAADIYLRTPQGLVLETKEQFNNHWDQVNEFAVFWESLNEDNYWGGRWKFFDPYHWGTKKG